MGVNLFVHSVRLVLADWRTALRITGLLYLIYAVPSLLLSLIFPVPTRPDAAAAGDMLSRGPIFFIVSLLALVVFVWIAVAWHRYILLDEVPTGQVPSFNQSPMLSYAAYSIGLLVLLLVISFVVGIIMVPLIMIGAWLFFVIIPLITITLFLVISYRLGLVLPAAAIGKPLTFGQAWEATKGTTGAILVLAIVSALASIVIDIPLFLLSFLGGFGGILALIWGLATGWIKMLVGVSILTTLYGVYIEKRSVAS